MMNLTSTLGKHFIFLVLGDYICNISSQYIVTFLSFLSVNTFGVVNALLLTIPYGMATDLGHDFWITLQDTCKIYDEYATVYIDVIRKARI